MNHKPIILNKETRQSQLIPRLMELAAPHFTIRPSDKVAIKINLSGSREMYANTHYETVESLLHFLRNDLSVSDIAVVEGSSGAYHSNRSTWDIFYKFRYKEVELNGARLINLDELPHNRQFEVTMKSGQTRTIDYTAVEADYIIALSPPKTHQIFPVSASILGISGYIRPDHRVLMFGVTKKEMRSMNFHKSRDFASLIDCAGRNFAGLYGKIPYSLSIIDGLYGMEGRGPVKGSPVFHGFHIASEDAVLTDALTAYVMGFDPADLSYLHYAYRNRIGNNRWKKVIGASPSAVRFPYRPHPLHEKQKEWKRRYLNKRGPHGQKTAPKNHRRPQGKPDHRR